MVNLVDILVQRTPMHSTMSPIMPCIFDNKENGNLHGHLGPAWERYTELHSEVSCHWVEEPDLWEFDGEMREENEFRTCPLFGDGRDLGALDLVFVKVSDLSNDNPGEGSSEVDGFVHYKGEDAGGKRVVLHVGVPTL